MKISFDGYKYFRDQYSAWISRTEPDRKAQSKLVLDDSRSNFQSNLQPFESGQGYALRMALMNGLIGLQQVKVWLGKSRFATLDSRDALLLHQWFGADEALLTFALGQTAIGKVKQSFAYAGHPIGRDYFLNKFYPRVCIDCLLETGYCILSWDIGLVVCCPKHSTLLVDRCSLCMKPLSWIRSRLSSCSCSAPLERLENNEAVKPVESQFAAWVDRHIGRNLDIKLNERPTALTVMLEPLSLNGGFHIAHALGTIANYVLPKQESRGRSKLPLDKARVGLTYANNIAERILNGDPIHLSIKRPSVVANLLAEACSTEFTVADQSLAQSVFHVLFGHTSKCRTTGVNPNMAQMPLF
jgi:hypothetical protein